MDKSKLIPSTTDELKLIHLFGRKNLQGKARFMDTLKSLCKGKGIQPVISIVAETFEKYSHSKDPFMLYIDAKDVVVKRSMLTSWFLDDYIDEDSLDLDFKNFMAIMAWFGLTDCRAYFVINCGSVGTDIIANIINVLCNEKNGLPSNRYLLLEDAESGEYSENTIKRINRAVATLFNQKFSPEMSFNFWQKYNLPVCGEGNNEPECDLCQPHKPDVCGGGEKINQWKG